MDDTKNRTVRARDPSEPHVTCSSVWSGVRGQESNRPAYLTSSSWWWGQGQPCREKTRFRHHNNIETKISQQDHLQFCQFRTFTHNCTLKSDYANMRFCASMIKICPHELKLFQEKSVRHCWQQTLKTHWTALENAVNDRSACVYLHCLGTLCLFISVLRTQRLWVCAEGG